MKSMRNSISIKFEVARKILHIALTLLLLIPLSSYYRELFSGVGNLIDPTLLTYSTLLFASALINSIQIRMPYIRLHILNMFRDYRKKVIDYVTESLVNTPLNEFLKELNKIFSRYEESLDSFIESVERDYEKRYGYVSVTFALLSIFLSYVTCGYDAYVGILALAFVDSITSIVTLLDGKSRKVFKHTVKAYLIAFSIFASILFFLVKNIIIALIVSATSILVEMFSPEDNLTLPLIPTVVFSVLKTLFI